MGAEPALAILDPRLGRRHPSAGMDHRADAANDAGVRGQRAREVRLQLERRPADTSFDVVTNASPIAESIRVIASPACTIPIGL